MIRALRDLQRDEGAATAVEYALILAGIAGVILVIVTTLGGKVRGLFANAEANFPAP